MKRASLIPMFFCLSLFLIPLHSHAQGFIITVSEIGTDPPCDNYGDNLTINMLRMTIANLDPPTVSNPYWNLPPEAEPMFMQMSVLGMTFNFPLVSFEFKEMVNGHPTYRPLAQSVNINPRAACLVTPRDGIVDIHVSWRLTTATGEDYPVHNIEFIQPDGIFSCEVFIETCYYCSGFDICGGEPINLTTFWEKICFDCNRDPNLGTMDPKLNRYTNGPAQNTPSLLSVSPNPFDNHLALEYNIDQLGPVSISVFNVQGRMMTNRVETKEAGLYRETFDTSKWAAGIYYCKIQTGEQSEFIKVIKVN